MEIFTIFGSLLLSISALIFSGDLNNNKIIIKICSIWSTILNYMFIILIYSMLAKSPWLLEYKHEFIFFEVMFNIGNFIYTKYPGILKSVYNIALLAIIAGYFGLGLGIYSSYANKRIKNNCKIKTKPLVVIGSNFIIIGTILILVPVLK